MILIKWIVRRYLNRKYEYLKFQLLSLEQELGYADDNEIDQDEVERLLIAHENNIKNINSLERVFNEVI